MFNWVPCICAIYCMIVLSKASPLPCLPNMLGPLPRTGGKKTSPSKTQKLQRFRAQRCLQVGDCLGYHRDLAQQIQTAKWQLERHLRDPESVRKGQRKKHIDDITSDCPTVLHQLTSLWCCGFEGTASVIATWRGHILLANSPRHRRFCCPRHQRRLSKSAPPGGPLNQHGVLTQFVSCIVWVAERGWKAGNGLFFLVFVGISGSPAADPTG